MKKYFRPQRDITAYEVAWILGHAIAGFHSPWHGVEFSYYDWDRLGPEMQRHFTDDEVERSEQ